MSELARRRNARDLWISRSHLVAMGIGGLAVAVGSFAGGFVFGQQNAPAVDTLAGTADPALLEILSRVESCGAPRGVEGVLTYTDALRSPRGSAPTATADAPAPSSRRLALPPAATGWWVVVARGPDAASVTEAQAGLHARGIAAWIGPGQEGTVPLVVGGFATEAEARAALADMGGIEVVEGERAVPHPAVLSSAAAP